MKNLLLTLLLFAFIACNAQKNENVVFEKQPIPQKVSDYYQKNKGDASPSKSIGTVKDGKLQNAKLVPFQGLNFQYFDTASYLAGRAFVIDKVKQTVVSSYKEMETVCPNRFFFIMECSNKGGGKIFPHRTHQNGMSIDYMTPLLKAGKPYYQYDTMGVSHYLLEFDNEGKLLADKDVSVDFETIAKHILSVEKAARANGLKISKVIFKIELKDELFATDSGKKLQSSGIYIVQQLTPLINSIHDDHYHIDFERVKK